MELVLRITEKSALMILLAIVAVSSAGLVFAYGGNTPSAMGHTWGEMECSDCILSGNIATGAVGSSEIDDSAVGTDEIASNAVTAAKIADNAVGSSEIASNAVRAAEIQDGAVSNDKLSCPCGACWATRTTICNPPACGNCISERELCTPGGWAVTSGTLETDECGGGG